ncbi:MAG: histidinol dehydrogenase [Muribaculaceae bacterium]|nr:histidinol dehydrogenase [Muribaculaceae bacterium]
MEILRYPDRKEWPSLCQRALASQAAEVKSIVADIISNVRRRGDKAIREYEQRFTGAICNSLKVSDREIAEAEQLVSDDLKQAIIAANDNIARFHAAQKMQPITVETALGITCSQKAVPITKVGLYIPGGNSPLFSTVLMLATPARIAGCREIILCTPADRNGKVHPAILFAAKVAGVSNIYKTGGAQAIAAMAYGTETIPAVYKIFGPGNRFVMEAKQQVSQDAVAIDMPAGPSEVMVIADDNANADFVAADFLSQAEHGPDSQSILLTTSTHLVDELPQCLDKMLNMLPRREMMEKSLSHSRIILLRDMNEVMDFSNTYAPEHLIINHADADALCEQVENAGSVFVGQLSPESAGDYASGTNHTLPTSGYATAYSGVNLDSFCKKITFQKLTPQGINSIGRTVEIMAENEDLNAHKLAMTLRIEAVNKD